MLKLQTYDPVYERLAPSNLRPFYFPGGEPHIFNGDDLNDFEIAFANDPADFMQVLMWAEAVNEVGITSVLFLPYLPAARMDRGIPFGAKVYAELLSDTNISHIITLDPHSMVMPALIEPYPHIIPLTALPVFYQFIGKIAGVIAPDNGAFKRAETVGDYIGVPTFQAKKYRNFATGQLSGFGCEILPEGNFLLVDDICDGGGTFIGLADYLIAEGKTPEELSLFVTHGIFSKGTKELRERFSLIATTNSHSHAASQYGIHVADLEPVLLNYLRDIL